ncbi:hypothetical protein B0H11DRAFT_195819 [Mycena galericulata]|nr:hypothetical protein B0H11DRAFT_195819 [Mycena galericulata]
MPRYSNFLPNPAQSRRIMEDIHGQETLPPKYDSDDGRRRPDLRRGWLIGDIQREIIMKYIMENHPTLICVDGQDAPHTRTTVLLSAKHFAWHYDLEGGVTPARALDANGEEQTQWIFFFDDNGVVPEVRYTKEQWEPLAKALHIAGEPRWYLTFSC